MNTCAICGAVFESTWSDEEALAEAEETFGVLPDALMETVCDDCYRLILDWAEENDWPLKR